MVKATVLVTGAAGFIGKHVTQQLMKEKYKVTALVRKDSLFLKKMGCKSWKHDLRKPLTNKKILKNIDVVVHLAGKPNVREALKNPKACYEYNTQATLHLLEAIGKTGNKPLFIYLSTDRVYGWKGKKTITVNEATRAKPVDPYATAKYASEVMVKSYRKAYGLPYVILRAANVYGPMQDPGLFIPSFIQRMVEAKKQGKKTITIGNITTYRNFVYVQDLAKSITQAVKGKKECINQTFNIAESNVQIKSVAEQLVKLGSKHLKTKFSIKRDKTLVKPAKIELSRYLLDTTKAKKLLHWKPQYSLKKGLEATIKYYL